jgi:osmotically-inducible protein OsmY
VRLEQRTVYLSGAVRDARQSQVAELMMSFQPGVSRVVNQIQVVAGE